MAFAFVLILPITFMFYVLFLYHELDIYLDVFSCNIIISMNKEFELNYITFRLSANTFPIIIWFLYYT